MKLKKSLGAVAGGALIGLGGLLTVSPVPFGFVVVTIGASLLASRNEKAAAWLRRRRRALPGLDAALRRAQDSAPKRLTTALRITDPAKLKVAKALRERSRVRRKARDMKDPE